MTEVIWPDLNDSARLINESNDFNSRLRCLRIFNLVMGILHGIQALAQLILVVLLPQYNDVKLPISVTFVSFNSTSITVHAQQQPAFSVAPLVTVFFSVSTFFHFLIVTPGCIQTYTAGIGKGYNVFRWIEHAISSSIMMWLISMLLGVYDIAQLISIVALNVTMSLNSLVMEIYNPKTERTKWTSFCIAIFSGSVPWIVLGIYFVGLGSKDQVPDFVYALLISYFVFYSLFPINMLLHYKKVGKWRDYVVGEIGYVVLNLVSKSVVGWLVFYGFYQSSPYSQH